MAREQFDEETPGAGALLLTRGEVARMLGVSRITVDRWTKAGKLQPVDIFDLRRVLFRRADIEAIVAGLSHERAEKGLPVKVH